MTAQRSDKNYPPVIGKMAPLEVAEKLRLAGDTTTALAIQRQLQKQKKGVAAFAAFRWPWADNHIPAWRNTAHAFGFIPKAPSTASRKVVDISDAGNISADTTLKNARIKITLDRLRVFEYPGNGAHTVLLDFYARHQTSGQGDSQDLHFNQHYRVQQGSGAGITGSPVFVGLNVGGEGVSFRCYTVNVKNDNDQKILSFLDNDVFKKGLSLINTMNPAIPVVSAFATGIVKSFASRNDNIAVQDFFMGLDFSGIQTRAQLAEGSYIAVQVGDASTWDWCSWLYRRSNGQILSKKGNSPIPLNYIVFSISRM